MSKTSDIVVIGGGIAGISAACMLAERGCTVHLLEAEDTLAHHATGRSAAIFLENYGPDAIRRLTLGGRSYLQDPPYADAALWSPLPFMSVGDESQVSAMRERAERFQRLVPSTRFITTAEAVERCPVLRPDVVAGAILEPDAKQLDVAGLHQMFVRGFKANGGSIRTSARVVAIVQQGSGWHISTATETFATDVVVNAAGAWCDQLAQMANVHRVGVHPLRRSVAIAALPDEVSTEGWPFVDYDHGDDGSGYFRPEAGGLLISPADETPSEPCDAKPEELDVARGIANAMRWTTLDIQHVHATWAGLRSFVADRNPVCGFARDAPGFFWLAGQGGYGIHSAAGLAVATAGLICEGELPASLQRLGVTAAELDPGRDGLGPPPGSRQ